MPSKADLIRKFWEYPNLRQQIPSLIDSARAKFFKLQDATNNAETEWHEMEKEYSRLRELEQSAWKPANKEQAEGRLNRVDREV
jgi:hypothetical protein